MMRRKKVLSQLVQNLAHAKIVARVRGVYWVYMKQLFIALVFFALPTLTFAAGFSKQSLFLSRNAVTEGETVLIHAVVSNENIEAFTGTLILKEGDVKIGTVPVTLAAQEAQAVSVSWKPVAGSHTIEATLTATDGEVAEKQSATFRIQEKPKPDSNEPTIVESSEDIQAQLANLSPGVAQAATPVFSGIDSVRNSAVSAIDKGIAWAEEQATKKKATSSGSIAGAQDTKEDGGIVGTIWTIAATLLLHLFNILKYLISNAAIFYPLFAVLFLYGLWRLYKRMRRPAYPEF